MKLAVGSDHAGFVLKQAIIAHLVGEGHEVLDLGAHSVERYDYPDASDAVASAILSGTCLMGVLVCGSGVGVCIRANRHPGIRAAQIWSEETAKMSREHNHANVACFGERMQAPEDVLRYLDLFLAEPEDHGERHEKRVKMLDGNISC